MITSLMQDSFNKLDQYMNENYVEQNVCKEYMLDSSHSGEFCPQEKAAVLEDNGLVEKFSQYVEQQNPKHYSNNKKKLADPVAEMWSESESESQDNSQTLKSATSSMNDCFQESLHKFSNVNKPNVLYKKRTSLSYLLKFPNMKRKFVALVILSMSQFSLYVIFNFFILDFIQEGTAVFLHHFLLTTILYSIDCQQPNDQLFLLFAFAIIVNLLSVIVTLVCLKHLGRKLTFLMGNAIATLCTLLTGFVMTSYCLSSFPSLENNHIFNLSLIFYATAKFFQTSSTLVLMVWIYELLPPIAECSTALHTCITLANFQLLFIPLVLYYTVSGLFSFFEF